MRRIVGGEHADHDRLAALFLGQARRRQPITTALSPASTRSIMTTVKNACTASPVNY